MKPDESTVYSQICVDACIYDIFQRKHYFYGNHDYNKYCHNFAVPCECEIVFRKMGKYPLSYIMSSRNVVSLQVLKVTVEQGLTGHC